MKVLKEINIDFDTKRRAYGGLVPSESLMPSESLIPQEGILTGGNEIKIIFEGVVK